MFKSFFNKGNSSTNGSQETVKKVKAKYSSNDISIIDANLTSTYRKTLFEMIASKNLTVNEVDSIVQEIAGGNL